MMTTTHTISAATVVRWLSDFNEWIFKVGLTHGGLVGHDEQGVRDEWVPHDEGRRDVS